MPRCRIILGASFGNEQVQVLKPAVLSGSKSPKLLSKWRHFAFLHSEELKATPAV